MAKKILFVSFVISALIIGALVCALSGSETAVVHTGSSVRESFARTMLWAQTGSTIEFRTQNGITRQGSEPQVFNIPHLILYRNQILTEPAQRTLQIEVAGIQVPPAGAMVSLLIETQNGEPVSVDRRWERIPAWQETRSIPAHNGTDLSVNPITFTIVFPETILLAGKHLPTPSDYYRYEITVTAGTERTGTVLYTFKQEYAFLLENQWIVQLPEVPEETSGAAPDELVIYSCDMFPFQKDIHDPATWVAREAVSDFVGYELLPKMVAAFRLQSQEWGFPWYQTWTSGRLEGNARRLSIALTDGKTWYHGQAFPRGNSLISINVFGGENYRYDTLSDGVLSTFHHELFHNHQRNLNQHYGGAGWIGGRDDQWQFVAEGTAVLASSVAQPEIQFAPNAGERAYLSNANLFLGSATIQGDIGKAFSEISPYHAALYWRFLYEQCGGMTNGIEDSAVGMQIIRRVLTSLYQTIEREEGAQADFDSWMPRIMDQALRGSACPFQTYPQSLAAFIQAIEALRDEDGRCQKPGLPEGCGFYDPYALYNDPPGNPLTLMADLP